jgi:hypothetical protein
MIARHVFFKQWASDGDQFASTSCWHAPVEPHLAVLRKSLHEARASQVAAQTAREEAERQVASLRLALAEAKAESDAHQTSASDAAVRAALKEERLKCQLAQSEAAVIELRGELQAALARRSVGQATDVQLEAELAELKLREKVHCCGSPFPSFVCHTTIVLLPMLSVSSNPDFRAWP